MGAVFLRRRSSRIPHARFSHGRAAQTVSPANADPLLPALAAALLQQGSPWAGAVLHKLRDKGLAHDHVRLAGTGVLARVPKQSQLGLAARDNLAYQAACFERAAASGHAPRLLGRLEPSAQLPRGALLVEEIVGRAAVLPADLLAIARALAAIHSLALPPQPARAPLLDAADPLRALLQELESQGRYLHEAGIAPLVLRQVQGELERLAAACAAGPRPQRHLIAFDGHPGNFIIRGDGSAVLVDLEKCRYSYPGLDLAHATLYTSTTWDVESHAVLRLSEVLQAYAAWADAVGPQAAAAARPWHVPLRRAMWLWSLTWCAKWRVASGRPAATLGGEDWSTERSDALLVDHVRERVDHYLSPEVVALVLAGFESLDQALAR